MRIWAERITLSLDFLSAKAGFKAAIHPWQLDVATCRASTSLRLARPLQKSVPTRFQLCWARILNALIGVRAVKVWPLHVGVITVSPILQISSIAQYIIWQGLEQSILRKVHAAHDGFANLDRHELGGTLPAVSLQA